MWESRKSPWRCSFIEVLSDMNLDEIEYITVNMEDESALHAVFMSV